MGILRTKQGLDNVHLSPRWTVFVRGDKSWSVVYAATPLLGLVMMLGSMSNCDGYIYSFWGGVSSLSLSLSLMHSAT